MPSNGSLTLFRHALFTLHPVESGCPALYSMAPFGGRRPLLDRIAEILGQPAPSTATEIDAAIAAYVELFASFGEIVRAIDVRPGPHRVVDVPQALEQLMSGIESGLTSQSEAEAAYARALDTAFADWERTFELTDTAIAMARHSVWQMEDRLQVVARDADGARAYLGPYLAELHRAARAPGAEGMLFEHPIVCGDGKRPYGNLTYYYRDLEVLGVPGVVADEAAALVGEPPRFSDLEQRRIDRVQRELYLVLQAMAQAPGW